MWPWAWESPEEDGHWAGKRTKPREQHQVSSDMDPDLVGADLQDVGGKESEGSRGGVRRCLQATPGDGWTAAQRPAPPRGQRALCLRAGGYTCLTSAQGRGLLRAQPLGEPD